MVIDRIKSLFSLGDASKMKEVNNRLEKVLASDLSKLVDSKEQLDELLELMENEVKRIRSQANGYPNATIAGDVWFDGAALAEHGEALANFLPEEKFLEEKAKATIIWTGAVLSVCSHYHHMVGPAMIANAKISEKMGNMDYAKGAYSAVLQDFECILEYAEEDDTKPIGEDLVAIQSLESAAKRLVELNDITGVNAASSEILERIKIVMDKPSE